MKYQDDVTRIRKTCSTRSSTALPQHEQAAAAPCTADTERSREEPPSRSERRVHTVRMPAVDAQSAHEERVNLLRPEPVLAGYSG